MTTGNVRPLSPEGRRRRLAQLRYKEQLMLELGLPQELEAQIADYLGSQYERQRGRPWVQRDTEYELWLVIAIQKHVTRPNLASFMMAHLFQKLDWRSQEAKVTRQELAELCGVPPRHISTTLTELEQFNFLWREPIPGTRHYKIIISPRLATYLPREERDAAIAEAPPILDPRLPLPAGPAPKKPPSLRLVEPA